MIGAANLSSCGKYRYSLSRDWSDQAGRMCFIMLNPSTADSLVDDPTIRRCVSFAKRWGYGAIDVVNLFAWRATDPKQLRTAVDPIGEANDEVIQQTVKTTWKVVAAWGVQVAKMPKPYRERAEDVIRMVQATCHDVHAIRVTRSGHPEHPLYLPETLSPTMYREWRT